MPYTVENDPAACSPSKPWAVRKTADGEVIGCHATKEAAVQQIAAIESQEGE